MKAEDAQITMLFKWLRSITVLTQSNGLSESISDLAVGKSGLIVRQETSSQKLVWQSLNKRTFDLIAGFILFCIAFPFFLIIAIIIKLNTRGPVFFRQERIGYKEKSFTILKFRTMQQEESDTTHQSYIQLLLQDDNVEGERAEMVDHYLDYIDRRVTPIGRFLRATSLDELPQLINVLKGEMSLVGPRPHPTYEVQEYKNWYHRRFEVKPGLTGYSKLKLRCTPKNYEEAILHDLWYVDHRSFSLDMKIFAMTIPYVLLHQGGNKSTGRR